MPFLAPALPWLIGLGSAAGGVASARAAGRSADAHANQQQDQNAMEAARLNLQAPGYRANNAVTGDILSNAKDFQYGAPSMVGNIPVPSSTGGLRPSIFSPQTKQLGTLQTAQALSSAQTNHGNVANVTPLPQPGLLDKILGVAGTVGGLASAYPDIQDLQSKLPYRRNAGTTPPSPDDWSLG